MTFAAKAASIFGYRVLPTSLLALATYLAISLVFLLTDTLPGAPKREEQGGLDLQEALIDLHHITAYPHPYNSHANDQVHDYILSRLESLAKSYPHVHVTNDIISNKTWFSNELGGAQGEYFEGTNILVKVDGTSGSSTGGVLFSAHYDSVSTARGATDDGMGVVTLMQLVKVFATQRQPRTAVFNINNGEEDGLHGANVFLEHPWSKLTDTFLNLEGAAAGGRPILFRATSETAMKALSNKKLVPHPHANVLSSDAFSRGFIKSGTDFSVYAGAGKMAGLDLAFYKGRSKYHTKYDSMQYTVGGEKSLWSMMESAKGIGLGLLHAHNGKAEGGDDAVYFDIFKSAIVVFRLKLLLIFNIFLLIMGPLFLIMLIFCETIVLEASKWNKYLPTQFYYGRPTSSSSRGHGSRPQSRSSVADVDDIEDDEHHSVPAETRSYYMVVVEFTQLHSIWRHAKFWVALATVIAIQILLVRGYVKFNSFAIYSSPYVILLSCTSLAYLTLVYVLTLPTSLPFLDDVGLAPPSTLLPPAQQDKQTIFFHLYGFTWLLLVLGTIGITQVHPGVGGGYLFSVWNACVTLACVLVGVEGLLAHSNAQPTLEQQPTYDELSGDEADNDGDDGLPRGSHRRVEDANEGTPLIWQEGNVASIRRSPSPESDDGAHDDTQESDSGNQASGWWIAQFLVSVPVPIILFGQVAMLLLDSMPQTLADGGAPWRVYVMTSLPSVLLIIPLAPFAAKLQPCHRLSRLILAIFVVSTFYALWVFPFSVNAPLKIFFRQTVGFPGQQAGQAPTRAPIITTELTGAKDYLQMLLIPTLPSAQGKAVHCREDKYRPGLVTCGWENKLLPVPGSYAASTTAWAPGQFFRAHVQPTGATSGRVRVKARNSRVCRLYFDSPGVEKYHIQRVDDAKRIPKRAMGAQQAFTAQVSPGVKELRLSTRTWEQELAIDLSWASQGVFPAKDNRTSLHGRVACQWAEYESGMVDTGVAMISNASAFQIAQLPANRAKIPAFEEASAYLPDWAVLTKYTDGLVEVWAPFVL